MKKNVVLLASLLFLAIGASSAQAIEAMADYSDVPFFMTNAVQPNILIIQDNSGSMNEFAYGSDGDSDKYDDTKSYYGYYSKLFCYTYASNTWSITSTTLPCAATAWKGNFLNFVTMRKIDVARKVLMGGKATSRTGGGNQHNIGEAPANGAFGETQVHSIKTALAAGITPFNPDATYWYKFTLNRAGLTVTKYLKSNNNSSACASCPSNAGIDIAKDSTLEPTDFNQGNLAGIMQQVGSKARWGLMFFDPSNDGGQLAQAIPSTTTNFITTYQNTPANTATPLAETLYTAIGYFKQDATIATYFKVNGSAPNAAYTTGAGVDPFNYSGTNVSCGKNFIILLTDGDANSDELVPAAYSTYGGSNLGTSDQLDNVALWGHTVDLRSDIPGTQVINLYTVYTFGTSATAKTLLQNAAKYGAFLDSNGNNLPDLQSEWATLGRTYSGVTVPDTYYEASDGDTLESELMLAIEDILKRASSGTAISVLATSANGAGNIFQAYFLPVKTVLDTAGGHDVEWMGHLLSLNIDTMGSIRDKNNTCITFGFDATTNETMVNTVSSNSNGTCGTTVTSSTMLIDWTNYNWDAGDKLLTATAASRTIFTFVDANKNGVMDTGERVDFTTANAATLQKYMRTSSSTEATNIINFIRGNYVSTSYRDRTISSGNQWKLGDIIHSTPTVVGPPAENYGVLYKDTTYANYLRTNANRSNVVYVGANDGMLHAFDTTTGNELWAFIPYNLLPHLKWLADVSYTHVDYVDLKVKATDVNFGTPASPNWKTILIGGMRWGGGEISDATYDVDGDGDSPSTKLRKWRSSFFALDVSTPTSPVVLWEFGHNLASYGLTDNAMGYSQTYPCIVKVGDSFFAVVGSGAQAAYTPLYDGTTTQSGRLFVINIKTGALAASFPVSDSNSWFADPVAVDIDFRTDNAVTGSNSTSTSYNTEVVYVGETYYASSQWASRMWRLVTNSDVNPANWKMYDMYNMASKQPITGAPGTSSDKKGNTWVFFGTGKFYNTSDKSDVNTQTLYGIKDPCWDNTANAWKAAGGCTWGALNTAGSYTPSIASTQLLDVTSAAVTTASAVSGVTGATTFSGLLTLMDTMQGWFVNLTTTGERSLNKPSVIGGLVLFSTFVPTSDVCSVGGNSYFWAVYYETGTAYYKSAIGTSGTTVLRKSSQSYSGMGSSIAVHSGREAGAQALIQMSTGQAIGINFNPVITESSGIIAWREL